MERSFHPILRQADFEAAPDDDQRAFIYLEEKARERLYKNKSEDQNGNTYYPRSQDYMTRISGVAAAYGIPGIEFDPYQNNQELEFTRFIHAVDYQTAQISALLARDRRKNSLRLESSDRAKIRHHIDRIRELVQDSELTEKRKDAILSRATSLEQELEKSKVDTKAILIVASMVLAAAANLKTIEEPLVRAGTAMIELVGNARLDADERQQNELPRPQPKLVAPPKPKTDAVQSSKVLDLDDDIPF